MHCSAAATIANALAAATIANALQAHITASSLQCCLRDAEMVEINSSRDKRLDLNTHKYLPSQMAHSLLNSFAVAEHASSNAL